MTATAADAGRLARFRLLRELGRGAQARVWLAHDPRLDRDVALKLLDTASDPGAVLQWRHEAQAVSRLTHPNIVPVFEADEYQGQPYLVFEFVDGPTLAQARKGQKAMPARDAVALLLDVLDALAAAHALGVVHRDLKPSNILLGKDGRARVMDFGIAARVLGQGQRGDGRIVGTPGYMSPEAARGDAPVPAMDVFAAGVLLGELLAGAPLLRESDSVRAVERVQREDLVLPAATAVDATLRGIVQRALARDVAARYDSARAMHAALKAWLQPDAAPEPDASGSPATLQFLLRRMRHKTDFPALSASIVRIQRVATSETESVKVLADEILKDVALTNKLLRMVNTAHFTSASGGGVGTVSRAVSLVGFAGIRNMALSVVLLEHMHDKVHAGQLKEEFLRALMAASLAEQLTPQSREAEEAFLGAMFQNLGRLLTECYLPEEAVLIRQAIAGKEHTPQGQQARLAASRQVLGLGLDELGAGVARAWGLPESLQRVLMAPDTEQPPRSMEQGLERLRWLGRGANAIADAMLAHEGPSQAAALQGAAELYGPVLGLQPRDILAAAQTSRSRLADLAQALGVHVAPGALARRLLDTASSRESVAAASSAGVDVPTVVMDPAGALPGLAAAGLMAQALDGLRHPAPGKVLRLNEVLQCVLGTMHQALGFRSVVLCLREPNTGRLVGRVGLGDGGSELCAAFRIKPDALAVADLFAWLCAKGADLLVSDAQTVAARLPAWYRERIHAPTFLLLPLMLKGAPIGLIYADKARAGDIVLKEGDLSLLRALRDQAAAAFGRASNDLRPAA